MEYSPILLILLLSSCSSIENNKGPIAGFIMNSLNLGNGGIGSDIQNHCRDKPPKNECSLTSGSIMLRNKWEFSL